MIQVNKMTRLLMLIGMGICFIPRAQDFNLIDINKLKDANPINNYWNEYYDNGMQKFEYAVLNSVAYFTADDGVHGNELWRSDGTSAGTQMVKDINPGAASSAVHSITVAGDKIYFAATDGSHGFELWVSDGTPQGTKMLRDIRQGIGNASPSFLTDANGTLYFLINYASTTDQLWKTDGTVAGTKLVANFYSAKFYYGGFANQLTYLNGRIFFVLNNHGEPELYVSYLDDGRTERVKDINPFGGSYPWSLTPLKGLLYFSADDGSGRKLWVSDGTDAGTYSANNNNNVFLYSDPFNNQFNKMATRGNKLYFSGYGWDNDGSKLCSYDVSSPSNNVEVVKSFVPGTPSHNLYNLVNVNGTIFFTVYAGYNTDQTLWKSDGTEAGTVQVKNINPGGRNIYWYKEFKNHNGTLLFSFYDDIHGTELWKSDGTEAGTSVVKEINPGLFSSTNASNTTYIGNNISLFQASDGKSGFELWRTDGTEAGTALVKNINRSLTASSFPEWLTSNSDNSKLLLSAYHPVYGRELWITDGVAAKLVKDICPGSLLNSNPLYLGSTKNFTCFFANILDTTVQNTSDAFTLIRLFKTDGTNAGTSMIQAPALENIINSGNGTVSTVCTASSLYFILVFNNATYQYELWRSDGTDAGTFPIKTNMSPYYVSFPVAVDNTVFFSNYDDTYGGELWKSDGTISGTQMVKDISPGYNSSQPYNLYGYNGKLYFNATNNYFQTFLWSSDGTETGTRPVKKTVIANFMLGGANGKLFFSGASNEHGAELWATDGTAAGTKMVRDIWPGMNPGDPNNSVSTGSLLYFIANDGATGYELWKSDGTFAGTRLVKDIIPGSEGYNNFSLANANGTLYFIKDDKLWSSDGTTNGTNPVNDATLDGVSGLSRLTSAGNKLFFTGSNASTGIELYAADVPASVATTTTDVVKTEIKPHSNDVYPNPAKYVLYVPLPGSKNSNMNLLVRNVSGETVISKTVNSGLTQSIVPLDISRIAPGVYFLKIVSGDGKEFDIKKFVKH